MSADYDEETRMVDVPLTVIKSENLPDWYVIERAEHDGAHWLEPTGGNGFALMCSARISNADIEGTAADMLGIAKAIRDRSQFAAKRCAAIVVNDRVELMSPRNSTYAASVPLAAADELAAKIESTVQSHAPVDGQ